MRYRNVEGPASRGGAGSFCNLDLFSLSRSQTSRTSGSKTVEAIGRTPRQRALLGLWIVVVLFSVFSAWNFAFSQQHQTTAGSEPDFTVVILPDTQYYTDETRGAKMKMFTAQTRWVAKNKKTKNIKAVIGLGDIVDNGNAAAEWHRADSAFRILDEAAVPYAPVLGNHDYDDLRSTGDRAVKNYNTYFGPPRFSRYSWYGGGYPAGSNESFCITFTGGARSYLVIALEYYPRTSALEWAQRVVDANPDSEVIITTHSYLDDDGRRIVKGGRHGPQSEGLTTANDNDAEEMWTKLIKRNKNIILVVSGHIAVAGGSVVMARRSDVGEHGNLVHQLLADYQWVTDGGSGYLRVMKFRPSNGIIEVTTYSPFLKTFLTDASNQFTLEYSGTSRNEEPPPNTNR